MVHLGVEAQVEARFGPFGDTANLDARSVHGLRQTYHRLANRFGRTRWNFEVTWVMWNLVRSVWRWSLCLCKVGARFAQNVPYSRKSFWTPQMEPLGDVGHVESRSVRLEMVLVLM